MTRPGPGQPPGRLRATVERRSAALLVALSRQPRPLVPLVSAALLLGVVFAPLVVAAACLLVLLALVGWLSYLSWPAVDGRGRAVRLVLLGLLLILGGQSLG